MGFKLSLLFFAIIAGEIWYFWNNPYYPTWQMYSIVGITLLFAVGSLVPSNPRRQMAA